MGLCLFVSPDNRTCLHKPEFAYTNQQFGQKAMTRKYVCWRINCFSAVLFLFRQQGRQMFVVLAFLSPNNMFHWSFLGCWECEMHLSRVRKWRVRLSVTFSCCLNGEVIKNMTSVGLHAESLCLLQLGSRCPGHLFQDQSIVLFCSRLFNFGRISRVDWRFQARSWNEKCNDKISWGPLSVGCGRLLIEWFG